jgi:RNA polymerase sigma-70 factor (ECF subfamily)
MENPAMLDVRLGFDRQVLPLLDSLHSYSLYLTRNRADADDLVQETYLRAFRSWHTFGQGCEMRRWLITICRNAFRRSRSRSYIRLESSDPTVELAAAYDEQNLAARLDLAPALCAALNRLHEPFRSAARLVDFQNRTYEEASAMLGVPIGTVRSRLFRARQQLRRDLAMYACDAGLSRSATRTRA